VAVGQGTENGETFSHSVRKILLSSDEEDNDLLTSRATTSPASSENHVI